MSLTKRLNTIIRLSAVLAVTSALLALFASTPGRALGSATVVSTSPENRSRVQAGLSTISIQFSEPINPATSTATVTGPKTALLPDIKVSVEANNPTWMTIKTRRLVAGTYQVKWTSVSASDGSSTDGSFVFTTTGVSDCTDFDQTGKQVCGRFVEYWDWHGNLTQQGLPISDELDEKSDTDGKTYKVQYFERAVFELHPENQAPNDVLLSLLGNFLYQQKYPNGAPGQVVNTSPGAKLFPETGHTVGGRFLDYWNNNGGLAQQGYPISEEFQEKSDLDGKTYTVQYFERAVFEWHPENDAPYDVLLSQLGTFRYKAKYGSGTPATLFANIGR